MSSWDFKPGINNIEIKQTKMTIEKEEPTFTTFLNFELSGFDHLKSPHNGEYLDFYLYIFLVYYNGGKDFEIVSSAQHFIEIEDVGNSALFQSTFVLPTEHPYEDNFILNYYSLEICHSDSSAEDASDINMMLSNTANRLFSTKLDFKK